VNRVHQCLVTVIEEPAGIDHQVWIGNRFELAWLKYFGYLLLDPLARMEQRLAISLGCDEIDSKPFRSIACQGGCRGDNRTLVDQKLLERRALDRIG